MKKLYSFKFLSKSNKVMFVVVFCSMFIASNVTAATYLGFGLGSAALDLSNYESTTAVRLYFGSQFENNHGYELGVTQADYSLEGDNVLSTVVRNIVASYAYHHSLSDRFSLYGKAGLNIWKAEYQDFGNTMYNTDGTSLALGLGLKGDITPRLGIRLEYQYFDDVDITTVSQITLTGIYQFR